MSAIPDDVCGICYYPKDLADKCAYPSCPNKCKDRFLLIATGQIEGEMTDQTRRCPSCGSMSCMGECSREDSQ